ncbi:hypothetical protein G6F60_011748 [Rhizopus arrhizus]|nr:hypothetical protein G6F23_011806 [Rhizopus arrhizus]KAG1396749.1 hypothetical protein G6F58_011663 [Rhizopus delemar]KAG0927880.1 hypothetical protein G6F30_012565 [Rhizopus arrhizus]KAG0976915.1 hypothetical protein G6F28_012526 [Rhizopus arrhizus]KAG1026869.1 hypothetical protein G6F25_012619 [Rhizopus arrhizus]
MNIQKRNNSEAFTPTSAMERSKKKSALFDNSLEVEEANSIYRNTDFGGDNDQHPQWQLPGFNMTKQLKEYREVAIEGAQRRKQLSDFRVLALSFVFLISTTQRSTISQFEYEKQNAVMKDVKTDQYFEFVGDGVVMAYRKMQKLLSNKGITQDEAEDNIAEIMFKTKVTEIRTATKIVTDVIPHLINNSQSLNHSEGEAFLIIESLKVNLPFDSSS